MAAYYILRPVRDAMSSNWTDAELSTLFTATFVFSIAAVFLYGAAASRVKFRWLVPGVYGFFAISFVTFYFAVQMSSNGVLIDKAFYVWVSVFSLFQISVFWSLMADIFSSGTPTIRATLQCWEYSNFESPTMAVRKITNSRNCG